MAASSNQCWYKIIDDKFKVDDTEIKKFGISIDTCIECKYAIISVSYQQTGCGSRYCNDCYIKMKPKYYCRVCKVEDPNNIVHKKLDVFEDRAFKNDLIKMKMQCPDCHSEVPVIELEAHALEKCDQRWMMCNKCEILYQKSTEHKCKTDEDQCDSDISKQGLCSHCWKESPQGEKHDCKMNWEISCPYECKVKGYRKTHREESDLNHLDKMWAICKELKITDCKKADDSPEYRNWYDSTITQLKSALKFDDKSVQDLRKEVETLNRQLVEEKKVHDEIIANLVTQASEYLNTSFDGTIMWRIDKFSKLREDARTGSQTKVFSQPFYTSRFGYKMCLLLYPNGDSNNTGKAISVFLVIMKGNYDAMLRWPFQQKITFALIDQQLKDNKSHSIFPAVNLPSFSMPRTDMNPPAGISSFVKFEDNKDFTLKYFKNDTCFIQCVVDCADLHE